MANNPNTPSEQNIPGAVNERRFKTKKSNQKTQLLKDAVAQYFGADPDKGISIRASNLNKQSLSSSFVITSVQDIMSSLWRENSDEYNEIDDDDIREIGTEDIRKQLLLVAQEMFILRDKALESVYDSFPGLRKVDNARQELKKALSHKEIDDLKAIIDRRGGKRKNLVNTIFPRFTDEETLYHRSFQNFFPEVDNYANDDQKIQLARIVRNFEKFGSIPDTSEIEIILSVYQNAPTHKKRQVLEWLNVKVSLQFALDNDLISQEYVDVCLRNVFWSDIVDHLSPHEKSTFIHSVSGRNGVQVPVKDFKKTEKISELFTHDAAKEVIARAVQEQIVNRTYSKYEKPTVQKEEDTLGSFGDLVDKIRHTEAGRRITWIEHLALWAIVKINNNGEPLYFKIERVEGLYGLPLDVYDGTESGILIKFLDIKDNKILRAETQELSYKDFEAFISHSSDVEVIDGEIFKSHTTQNSQEAGEKPDMILDESALSEMMILTRFNIESKISEYDQNWRKYGFWPGTYFEAKSEASATQPWAIKRWRVDSVQDEGVMISSESGLISEYLSFEMLYDIVRQSHFKRVDNIKDNADFLIRLQDYGVSASTRIVGNQLVQDSGSSETSISYFWSDNGGHIKVYKIENDTVYFWEYEGEHEEEKNSHNSWKKSKKNGKYHLYAANQMTYGAFLAYLKGNTLKYLPANPIGEGQHTKNHMHDPHTHGSVLSRLSKMQTLNSMAKWVGMIWHAFEHNLEKSTKLDAARFAMGLSGIVPIPDGVEAQLYADIVEGSKETTEKYRKKLSNLPGPKWREKCIHIVQNRDARPEEVMAAILHMVEGYGHLYAENIKHYQSKVTRENLQRQGYGAFAFFDAFVHASRLKSEESGVTAYQYWRLKAYNKAREEMGPEGEPTEEQLLHALFKSIDGNWQDFHYAAATLKAIGGPWGYENSWKFKGFDDAYEKGKKQTQMVNAQGRLNRAVKYLNENEIYKAIGGMEMMAAKIKIPEYQAMPFIWAVWGYTRFATHTALQKLKNYAEHGLTFHAYAFLREKKDNDVYRETVRCALRFLEQQWKISRGALGEFDALTKRLIDGPESPAEFKKHGKPAATAMMEFWQKYQGHGLHDMLQGKNGWILSTIRNTRDGTEKKTLEAYYNTITDTHELNMRDPSIPTIEFGSDWYKEKGYQNQILRKADSKTDGGIALQSLKSMVNKIHFQWNPRGGRGKMIDDHNEKIWYFVKNKMETMRDESYLFWDESQKEKLLKDQFLQFRADIIEHFAATLSASSEKDPQVIERIMHSPEYPYYQDIAALGIDPRSIFHTDKIDETAEADYQRYKNHQNAFDNDPNHKKTLHVREVVNSRVAGTQSMSPANDHDDHKKKAA